MDGERGEMFVELVLGVAKAGDDAHKVREAVSLELVFWKRERQALKGGFGIEACYVR